MKKPLKFTLCTFLFGTVSLASGQISSEGSHSDLLRLRRQNESLSQSLVAANKRAEESSRTLSDIKLRLEAMGSGLLHGGEDRLVKAVSDLEVMSRKLKKMEEVALSLSSNTQNYLSTAIVSDPQARLKVESSLRALDTIIGLRDLPRKDRQLGNLQQAAIVSVDGESGVVIANVGEKEAAVVGMPFEVFRNDSKIAEALVALTRSDVSAFLITDLVNEENPVRRGDRVSFKRSN